MYKIKLIPYLMDVSKWCIACGGRCDKGGIEPYLYKGEEELGNICQRCVEKGNEQFSTRMEENAKRLKRNAEWIETLAKEKIVFPTPEDWKAAEKEFDRMFIETYGEEEFNRSKKAIEDGLPF
jgi:hypothetical protein